MTKLSIVTHLYNAQSGLDQQIAVWRTYPTHILDNVEFVVVDDFSDEPVTVDHAKDLNIRLFRVDDDIDWNMPGCRNLCAIQARSAGLPHSPII